MADTLIDTSMLDDLRAFIGSSGQYDCGYILRYMGVTPDELGNIIPFYTQDSAITRCRVRPPTVRELALMGEVEVYDMVGHFPRSTRISRLDEFRLTEQWYGAGAAPDTMLGLPLDFMLVGDPKLNALEYVVQLKRSTNKRGTN